MANLIVLEKGTLLWLDSSLTDFVNEKWPEHKAVLLPIGAFLFSIDNFDETTRTYCILSNAHTEIHYVPMTIVHKMANRYQELSFLIKP